MKRVLRNGVTKSGWLSAIFLFCSCSDFLTSVDPPIDQFEAGDIFNDNVTADAAISGIYADLLARSNGFAKGDFSSVLALAGLSADELTNRSTGPTSGQIIEFEHNSLRHINGYVFYLWASMYQTVYFCNSAIEGLNESTGTSTDTRNQLLGEAYFIRAFAYFHLVNLYGEVPLIQSTDYAANAVMPRTAVDNIYDRMVSDLIKAQELLPEQYPAINNERVRANKFVATALLARVYLYMEEWSLAEVQASIVISRPAYQLKNNLDEVFLKNSTEAIWQLRPNSNLDETRGYTWEGYYFSLSLAPLNNLLRTDLVNSFEAQDKRRLSWISGFQYGTETLYRPVKYKVFNYGAPLTEYSMILRLSEQYLIRAEARARQNKLSLAIDDLNVIRNRAGLANADNNLNEDDLVDAILSERKHELFTEWGHRWFDLKRTGRAIELLSPVKPGLTETDLLYPIPQDERNKNSNLTQNPGY